jgi:glycosyltransferase involved in cell wall biosynthesis
LADSTVATSPHQTVLTERDRWTNRDAVAGRPRLLFVVNHAGFFISHRLPLALAAGDAGYDVHVATPLSKHVAKLQSIPGLVWHEIELSRSGLNPRAEWRSFRELCALYRRLAPRVVHHVTSKPVLYGTIAARLTGVWAVVNAISGMGHVHAEGGLSRAVMRTAVSLAYHFALRHPRMRVIVQNREHRQLFVSKHWVHPADVILVPGAGVDVSRFVQRAENTSGQVVIVLASRLLYTKGVEDFVAAARLLRERGVGAHCVLVGEPDSDNPASVPAEVLQRWHGEGVVEYRGRQEDMPAVFAQADIVCLPTYYGEGIPKVLIEAAASALPIVTTDWPGCREIVEHGVNGLLVPIRNPAALSAALETLVRDAGLRRAMGLRGRERAVGDYSLDSVIRRTLLLYRELAPLPEL